MGRMLAVDRFDAVSFAELHEAAGMWKNFGGLDLHGKARKVLPIIV